MQTTDFLNLKKPDLTDNFDIQHFNDNADIINDYLKNFEGGSGSIDNEFLAVSALNNTYTLDLTNVRTFMIETMDTVSKNIVFDNVPEDTGKIININVIITYTNAATINYPASVTWKDDIPPTFEVGKTYILDFTTMDNGENWTGIWVESWL